MRHLLHPRTKMQDRDEFRERVHRDPQPEYMGTLAQPRAQFVQLQVRELEVPKPAVVQGRTVLASAGEPGVIVPSLCPNTRMAAATLSPSASALRTSATRVDGVLSR